MKTIRLFMCGALLLFISSASLSAQTNLIPNGDCETLDANGLPTGWTTTDGDTISTSSDDKQSGNYAAKFSCQWSRDIDPLMNLYSAYSTDSIRAGETYVLSFKYKSLQQISNLSDSKNFLNIECSLRPAISSSLYPAGTRVTLDELFGEWLSYEVEFTVPDKKPAYVIRFGIYAGNRIVYIDDVKLVKKVTETTTNLIPNGNFEEVDANGKPTSWGDDYNEDYTALTAEYTSSNSTDFKEGAKSGSFARNPLKSNISAKNWIKNLPANKTYNFSFWYKISDKLDENGSEPTFSMEGTTFYSGMSSANAALLGAPLNTIAGEWLFGEVNGIQSLSVVEDLIVDFTAYNCTYSLDDVQMVEASETGVNEVKADTKLPVYVSDGILYVGSTAAGETVSVYSITGQTIKSEKAQSTTTKITGLSRGQVYIVRCGGKSAKVVL